VRGQVKKPAVPVLGILGGIGSGKSTVAAEFGRLGCAVIQADVIAHEVLQRPDIREQVVRLLGGTVLDVNGRLDRKRVASIVFADCEKLAVLNRIIHPFVMAEVERRLLAYQQDSRVPAVVLDVPLLVEVGWADRCDRLIFVACDLKTRLARSQTLTLEQIQARENFQISLDKKANLADNTIQNDSDLSALAGQIATIFSSIVGNHGGL
jgi:dephospho-CoA kinase